ncbi:hypothetical protein V6N13_126677 [Hibiscus sabdariffa]
MMEKDFYLGRILTGRVSSGMVCVGDRIHGLRSNESGIEKIEEGKVVKLMKKKGTSMVLIDSAGADINGWAQQSIDWPYSGKCRGILKLILLIMFFRNAKSANLMRNALKFGNCLDQRLFPAIQSLYLPSFAITASSLCQSAPPHFGLHCNLLPMITSSPLSSTLQNFLAPLL